MARSARKFSQTFNGTISLNLGGRFFKLLSTVAAVTVQLYNKGQIVLDAVAVEGGFYVRGEFDRVDLTTSASELVEWFTSDEEAGSDRFTGSFSLSAVSAEASRQIVFADDETDDGNAFIRGIAVNNVAAQFAHAQIKNPAASGKTFYLDSIHFDTAGAPDLVVYGRNDTDLVTLGGALFNRDSGGAAASTQTRQQGNVAQLITDTWGLVNTAANTEAFVTFNPAVKLGAGEGFVVVGGIVNQQLRATFHGREY